MGRRAGAATPAHAKEAAGCVVSRGLGLTQLAALSILADRREGISSTDLATLLDLEPRRARTVVKSLVARDLVVVVSEGRARRVWLPDLRRRWLDDRAYVEYLLDSYRQLRSPVRICGCCGQAIITEGPRRLRAV